MDKQEKIKTYKEAIIALTKIQATLDPPRYQKTITRLADDLYWLENCTD